VLDWQNDEIRSEFQGYENLVVEDCQVLAVADGDVNAVALNPCPFFPKSGGQSGDIGRLELLDGTNRVLNVVRTEKPYDGGIAVCLDKRDDSSSLCVGSKVRAVVDVKHRASSSVHHTATHLLHAALRDVLGNKTGEMPVQAGSNVSANMLTFDFTHREAMSSDEIEMVQRRVNAEAEKSLTVSTMEMGLEEATERGAMAHFEDRYEDSSRVCFREFHIQGSSHPLATHPHTHTHTHTYTQVRVVEIGDGVSSELCCGTHVSNTNEVYPFLVLHERSVALGTRRIEAVAGHAAVKYLLKQRDILEDVTRSLDVESSSQLPAFVERMHDRNRKQKEEKRALERIGSKVSSRDLAPELNLQILNTSVDLHILSEEYAKVDASVTRDRAEALRDMNPDRAHVLLYDDRILCCGDHETLNVSANDILKELLQVLDGRGGGSSGMAQGRLKQSFDRDRLVSLLLSDDQTSISN